MPAFAIIDSHVHFYDPALIAYPWLGSVPRIDGRFMPGEYDAARGAVGVERLVFVEVDAAPDQAYDEARFVATLARQDRRVARIVAAARLDQDAAAQLDRLVDIPAVTGVRHLIQYYPEVDWCLRPEFVEGVRLLGGYGLSFDICIKHHQLASATELVRRCPEVSFILDHIAKPGIKGGLWQPWAQNLRDMARLPNVVCKMAGVTTEADPESWSNETVRPYIEHAIDCFGFDRLMFGSDWPVVNLAAAFQKWVGLLDEILAGCSETELMHFYRDTAIRTYKIAD